MTPMSKPSLAGGFLEEPGFIPFLIPDRFRISKKRQHWRSGIVLEVRDLRSTQPNKEQGCNGTWFATSALQIRLYCSLFNWRLCLSNLIIVFAIHIAQLASLPQAPGNNQLTRLGSHTGLPISEATIRKGRLALVD